MDTDARDRLIRVETKLDMLLERYASAAAEIAKDSQELSSRISALETWKTRVVTLYGAAIIILTTTGGAVTAWLLGRH